MECFPPQYTHSDIALSTGVAVCGRPLLFAVLDDGSLLAYRAFRPPGQQVAFSRLELEHTGDTGAEALEATSLMQEDQNQPGYGEETGGADQAGLPSTGESTPEYSATEALDGSELILQEQNRWGGNVSSRIWGCAFRIRLCNLRENSLHCGKVRCIVPA